MEINTIDSYHRLKEDISYLIGKARIQAYKAVDNIRVQVYWQIGERVNREKLTFGKNDYGYSVIEKLARDIGFRKRLLFEILQFYNVYPKVHALRAQLSWTHYNALIRVKDDEERKFYEEQTIDNLWSTRELERQIEKGIYKKSSKQLSKANLKLADHSQIFKDSYDFDFLGVQKSEKEFEGKEETLNHDDYEYDWDKDEIIYKGKRFRHRGFYYRKNTDRGILIYKSDDNTKKDVPEFFKERLRMKEKMEKTESRGIYNLRKVIVEPVIGDIKQNLGFREFCLRGLKKVRIELNLVSIGHNLKKIWINSGRLYNPC